MSYSVPIVILVYNRPEQTRRVFEAVREQRPERMFLVADGPKDGEDAEKCRAVREILENVDWPCQVERSYAPMNLGCGRRVSSGLDWVFSQVERAVVLEDDVVPSPDFFAFVRDALGHFQNDPEVLCVSGCNLLGSVPDWSASYFFGSFMMPPWGWATWARAWKHYRFADDAWPEIRERMRGKLSHFDFMDERIQGNRRALKTWDIQWTIAIWEKEGKIVLPRENLIENIGYGPAATFTRSSSSSFGALKTGRYSGPLSHPADKGCPFDVALEETIVNFIKEIG